MKANDMILDPDGRLAKLITLPIPGKLTQGAVVLYPDSHARVVDLAQCRPAANDQVIKEEEALP